VHHKLILYPAQCVERRLKLNISRINDPMQETLYQKYGIAESRY
jgi:hypothetical protein